MSFIGSISSMHAVTSNCVLHWSNMCHRHLWIIAERAQMDGASVMCCLISPVDGFLYFKWWSMHIIMVKMQRPIRQTTNKSAQHLMSTSNSNLFLQMIGHRYLAIQPNSGWDYSLWCLIYFSWFNIMCCIGNLYISLYKKKLICICFLAMPLAIQ